MKRLPMALVAFRLLCAPSLILASVAGASSATLVSILALAFGSDILDGVIARRLNVATSSLRRADSITDTVFWLSALLALLFRAPGVLRSELVGIVTIGALEIARAIVERAKFGRLASYHMWSAKAWGVMLFVGFAEAFLTARPGAFSRLAIVVGILSDAEGLMASAILSRWHHDVGSFLHALSIERETRSVGSGAV